MIEEKLSKLNETIPEANKSINQRNEIYQRVKEEKRNYKMFSNYKKMVLVSLSCVFVIVISIMIYNYSNQKSKQPTSLDLFFENNEYCERIEYQEWMEENEINVDICQGEIGMPRKTMGAIFDDGIYDVIYSNSKGFYFVVYVNTDNIKSILSLSGCMGHNINIKDIVRITNGIRVDYKELNENLLYVKCNDKDKIPAFIESFYPVQVFYMHEITVKEELLSSTKLDRNMFFSTAVCFEKNDSLYLIPSPIPEDAISVEDTLPGKNAIVISNDLETIKNSTIMNTLYYYSPQLFYDEHIVFYEYGFANYNWFYDEQGLPRKKLSQKMLSYLTKLKENTGSSKIKDLDHFRLEESYKGEKYYTVNNYNNINGYTYLETNDYINMIRLFGKSKKIENYSTKQLITNNEYFREIYKYSYRLISTYDEFVEAAKFVGTNENEYNEEFFKTKSICMVHHCIDVEIVRIESIIYIEGYYILNNVPDNFFIIEFDKNDIDESDVIIFGRAPIGNNS